MTTCGGCGGPMRVTKEQALQLTCSGLHFIEDGDKLIPVQSKGLRVGSYTVMLHVDYEEDVEIGSFCDLYRCKIGAHTKIKRYVEIQEGVTIGKFCKIQSHVFIPTGVTIGNYCFVGPNCVFTNDRHPRAWPGTNWTLERTSVEDNVSIGAGAVILPGVTLGDGCIVGAGSVVIKNVAPGNMVYGNPAHVVRNKEEKEDESS